MASVKEITARHQVSAPFQGEPEGSKAQYNQAREDRGFLLAVIASMEMHLVPASDVDIERARCVAIVNAARAGEIDGDLRCIRSYIEGGDPFPEITDPHAHAGRTIP